MEKSIRSTKTIQFARRALALGGVSAFLAFAATQSVAETYKYVVTTIAGASGKTGSVDGVGPAARFNLPTGVAVDSDGLIYVADFNNSTIRKIEANNVVTTFLGAPGVTGTDDGKNQAARFNGPISLVADKLGGVLYVADYNNNTIRQVVISRKSSMVGLVTTLTGTPQPGYLDGLLSVARFNGPSGLALDNHRNLYVADRNNHVVRKITPDGEVTTIGGVAGFAGTNDGVVGEALLNLPGAVAVDSDSNVYVADSGNFVVRKISTNGIVSTFAGMMGVSGNVDDTGTNAQFGVINGIAADAGGNLYVTDDGNTVRRISSAGVVTTLAGVAGTTGSSDGLGTAALFNNPAGLCVNSTGSGYLVDQNNATLRQLTLIEIPSIVTQPESQSIVMDLPGAFTVAVRGDQPLAYQWFQDGFPLVGGTNATFAIPSVQTTNAGGYSVIVTNIGGSVTSRIATLTILPVPPPTITSQPQNKSVHSDETVAFSVVASDFRPITYQWYRNGNPVTSGTNATLVLTFVQAVDAGDYTVVVSNNRTNVVSQIATLIIDAIVPTITSSVAVSAKQGTPLQFQVVASGTKPCVYSAQGLPGELVLNRTNGMISGTPLTSGRFNFTITVTNMVGSVRQTAVLDIVSSVPKITSTNSVTGAEGLPLSYQIIATDFPTNFAAVGLPAGMNLDPVTGLISGAPIYGGQFDATILAQNVWGTGRLPIHFNFSYAALNGLWADQIWYRYVSPYLIDFIVSLRDGSNNPVVLPVTNFTLRAYENMIPVNPDATGLLMQTKPAQLRANLVLDYAFGMAFSGDTNGDGVSDNIALMQTAAKNLIAQTPVNSLFVVNEFHTDDAAPAMVSPFNTDKGVLSAAIDNILVNNVQGRFGGSRLWDALASSLAQYSGAPSPYEKRVMVVFTDASDTSSTNITLANFTNLIKAASTAKVQVNVVYFGDYGDTNTLYTLTTNLLGNFYVVKDIPDINAKMALIAKELQSTYSLRWMTLNRTTNAVAPAFEISSEGFKASYNIGALPIYDTKTNSVLSTNYPNGDTNQPGIITTNEETYLVLRADPTYVFPASLVGNIYQGTLTLTSDPTVQPRSLVVNAGYIPRYVRQFKLRYRPNWPCTVQPLSTNSGGLLEGWKFTQTNDGAGGFLLTGTCPNPTNLLNSLPFGAQGDMLQFTFRDLKVTNQAFSLFMMDNTIYTNVPTGQSLAVTNTNAFVTVYPAAPHGTPIPWLLSNGLLTASYKTNDIGPAETNDPDKDGISSWLEFQAGTSPTNKNSFFKVVSFDANSLFDNATVSFSTVTNRFYRVEASSDLTNWTTLADQIVGIGNATNNGVMLFTDPRPKASLPHQTYRVLAH